MISILFLIDFFLIKYIMILILIEIILNLMIIEFSLCWDLNKVNMFILFCIGLVFLFILLIKNLINFCGYVY